ncbi:MAG: hypothetical protein C0418_05890, partial [Coriobacteriaceae bacterium]|nr:hypothetical protein [Coriobacteriaceae bacterium]
AWAAHTVLLGVSTAAIMTLVEKRSADVQDHDEVMVRGTGFGFAFFTLMLGVGAIYSYLLFADWYQWELVGAFAAAAWGGYGCVIHAAMSFGWRGRRLAWAVLLVLPLMLGTFWVWSVYSQTYHHFDITEIRSR